MAKFRIYKTLELVALVEAESAQAAYEAKVGMDDSSYQVAHCEYEVAVVNPDGTEHVADDVEL